MDLRNYKIQVGGDFRQPVIVCVRCADEVRASIPGQPSLSRLLEVATHHEWTVHRAAAGTDIAGEAAAFLKSLEAQP